MLVQTRPEHVRDRSACEGGLHARTSSMHVGPSARERPPHVHPDRTVRDRDEPEQVPLSGPLSAADARPHRNVRRGHVYAPAFSSAASSTTMVSAGSSVLADSSSSVVTAEGSSAVAASSAGAAEPAPDSAPPSEASAA